jgi:hypothetical protein
MRIVIPSRRRADLIQRALRLFPDSIVCVGEGEQHDYRAVCPNILVHPDNVTGIGPLRTWILQNVPDETVLMVDDDVSHLVTVTGLVKRRIEDAATVRNVVEHVALCAKDAGVSLFGFNQSFDVRKYQPFQPFKIRTWVGGLVGVIGRNVMPNVNLRLRHDIDWSLRAIARDRMVWIDDRFGFVHQRFVGSGGNAVSRSKERDEQELRYLKDTWRGAVNIKPLKGQGFSIGINI